MTICLVTDRRRLGRAMRADPNRWDDGLLEQVTAAVAANVDLIQLREPDLEALALFNLASRIIREVPGARERLVINDRLDVALAIGAAGVHLKERSIRVDDVKRLAPDGFRIGRSVHDVASARAAGGADYLIAGTVLTTPSKDVARLLGWDGLASIVDAAGAQPVLAIGGLTPRFVPQLRSAGASGLAAVGAFIPPEGRNLLSFVQETVAEMRFAFDSPSGLP